MKTNQEHFITNQQGMGLIYILIAVALFAALSFTLIRLNDTDEASMLSDEQTELYANQLMNYAVQTKSAIDQMLFSGGDAADLRFDLPGQGGFSSNTFTQVYHPDGGGMNPGKIPDTIKGSASTPTAGWYMGRFNNVGWTSSGNPDVMLVAYDIPENLCAVLNETMTGSSTIPVVSDTLKETLVDTGFHSTANKDLTATNCADCEGFLSLCVEGSGGIYGFYNVIIGR